MAQRKRSSKAKNALGLQANELRLIDFRTIELHCERFMLPEDALRGRFNTSATSHIGIGPEKQTPQELLVHISVELTGYQLKDDDGVKSNGRKTFSIRASNEFRYKLQGGRTSLVPEEVTDQVHEALLCQTYPLVITRMRSYAADMGFRGVRPDLGFDVKRATVEALAAPPRVARVAKEQ